MPVFPRLLPALGAAFIALAAGPARAATCNFSPANVTLTNTPLGSTWDVPNTGLLLCSGTYNVPNFLLRAGRRLELGDGAVVTVNVANAARIAGEILADGVGAAGGAGCPQGSDRGGGQAGQGPVPGPGGAAPAWSSGNGGGSGGGGAGAGANGGNGARGSGSGFSGTAGGGYGSANDPNALVVGAGGGGASCSSSGEPGGAGGGGGGTLKVVAKDLDLSNQGGSSTNTRIRANGGAGLPGSVRGEFLGIPYEFVVGAGGGGGGGGTIVLYATEQLSVAGEVVAAGGGGARGASTGFGSNTRRGGAGGGGAGGRVKIFKPVPCVEVRNNVAGGAGGGSAGGGLQAGESGAAGSFHCENIQKAPVATLASAPATIAEGGSTAVTASATDANGHLVKYEFDCNGDGTYEVAASTSSSATCSFPESGTYTVRTRVTDWNSIQIVVPATPAPPAGVTPGTYAAGSFAFGGSTVATTTVTVTNGPPVVVLTVDPATPTEGQAATLRAAVSDSPSDAAAGYAFAWTFGDTTTATVPAGTAAPNTQAKTWFDNGPRTVTVKVTDRDGGETTQTLVVNVANVAPTVTLDAFPSPVFAGESATFGAKATDPGSVDGAAGFDYVFTWGDGTTTTLADGGAAVTTTKTFAGPGTYTVSVVATDKDGGTSVAATRVLTVVTSGAPNPPTGFVFTTTPPTASIDETGSITIDVAWADPNGPDNLHPFTFEWDFGDGSPKVTGTTGGTGCAPSNPAPCTRTSTSHAYAESGSYVVTFKATDRGAPPAPGPLTGTGSITITVRNVAPAAALGAIAAVAEGGTASVALSASDLSAGDTAAGFTYVVSWGDGSADTTLSAGTAAAATHLYPDSGTYTVTLRATDRDRGTSAPVTTTATVTNVAPTVTFDPPASAAEGSEASFSAAANDVSPADRAAGFTYEWDFGDGSAKVSGAGLAAPKHTYVDDNTYVVTVTATDKDGGKATATRNVTITNVAPTVAIDADYTVARGEPVTLSATVSDPGTRDTLAYAWELGNGQTSTLPAPTATYATLGEFTVTVRVTDGDGGNATDTATVRVVNRAPAASNVVVSPAEPRTRDDLTLTFTYTDADGDAEAGTTVRWTVDGAPVSAFDDARTVPESATVRGQVWVATVTPKDGRDAGAPAASAPVTIGNDAPTATAVTIAPAAPRRADTLAVGWTFADSDEDAENGTVVRWTKNGVAQGALDDARTVPGPLTKGDVWVATVTPNDGALAGAPAASAPVTVGNTPPSIDQLDDQALPATGTTTPVTWTVVASDVDGDTLSSSCALDGQVLGTTATVTHAFAVGTYVVECTVSDGTDSVTDTLNVAVGDVPPVVDAGADQAVDPGRPRVTAVGRDTLQRPLTYAWTVVSSPDGVVLSAPDAASTDFFARRAGDYVLRVTVSNGAQSATDEVTVTVRPLAPTADAGPAIRQGRVGDALVLDGSASSDPNGDALTFLWERVSGPQVTFEGATTGATARLVPQAAGEVVVRLTVSDGERSGSTTVSLRISPRDPTGGTPPTANAGPDLVALVGETVRLDGSGSFDVDGEALGYDWASVSGPAVTLADADKATATFVAATAGTSVFRLTVSDGSFEARDEVTVTVLDAAGNERPVAAVNPTEIAVVVGDRVALSGAGSTDADGDALTYAWRRVSGPSVAFEGDTTAEVTFVPTTAGEIVVELVVNDGQIDSFPVRATVLAAEGAVNERPVAVARAPLLARVGEPVQLDGTESSDPEGAELSFTWRVASGPTVLLTGADAPTPSFTPTASGSYVFELVVNDGQFDSDPATVTLEVEPNGKPVAVATGPVSVVEGEPFTLVGGASSDPEGARLTYTWTKVSGPDLSMTGADTRAPIVVASAKGAAVFQLVVSDGLFESDPVQVTVQVEAFPAVTGGCGCNAGGGLGLLALAGLALLGRRRRRA